MNESPWNLCTLQFLSHKPVVLISSVRQLTQKSSNMRLQGIIFNNFCRTSNTDICQYSPCYIGLKNNVSTRLLETTLNRFPAGTEDFVSHKVLKDYIQSTAIVSGVQESTLYNTEVNKMSKSGNSWTVDTTTLDVDDSGETRQTPGTSVSAMIHSGNCSSNPYTAVEFRCRRSG
jgi:hypothetical protein